MNIQLMKFLLKMSHRRNIFVNVNKRTRLGKFIQTNKKVCEASLSRKTV